jgi:CP family cyanate transporter-like MFS transporter
MQPEKSSKMPWTILGSAWLLAFAIYSPMFCVPPMEHILKEELLLTHTQASLLFSTPLMMLVVAAIPGGLIADRIGVRKAAGIGIIIIVVGTILRSTATNYSSLLAFTLIFGIGIGLAYPNLPKVISAWTPREKAGMATGVVLTGIMVGGALALAITIPLILPITNTFQGVFFFWSIPSIAAAILWWKLVKEPPRSNIHNEPTSRYKAMLLQVLKNKSLWLVAALLVLENSFFFNWAGWAPALIMLKGATAELAGFLTSIVLWIGIPTVFLMPRLAYKLGLRKPFLWLPSIIIAFFTWGAIHIDLSLMWLPMALVGIADATRIVVILALPVELMPEEKVGTASGLVLSVGYSGAIIGPLIGGRILDITGSLDLSLLVLTGISIATAVVAFMLPETGTKNRIKQP